MVVPETTQKLGKAGPVRVGPGHTRKEENERVQLLGDVFDVRRLFECDRWVISALGADRGPRRICFLWWMKVAES